MSEAEELCDAIFKVLEDHRPHYKPNSPSTWQEILNMISQYEPPELASEYAKMVDLESQNAVMRQALVPFSKLLQAHNESGSDSHPIFAINDAQITRGDLRNVLKALSLTPSDAAEMARAQAFYSFWPSSQIRNFGHLCPKDFIKANEDAIRNEADEMARKKDDAIRSMTDFKLAIDISEGVFCFVKGPRDALLSMDRYSSARFVQERIAKAARAAGVEV